MDQYEFVMQLTGLAAWLFLIIRYARNRAFVTSCLCCLGIFTQLFLLIAVHYK